ncbi:hypothetical protein DBR22_00055 [Arthrobacter sp. HMWF013]|nr:hypothetical protein DBR22_00055 [Arthrobacter sp. HMWF013]
MVNLFCAPAVKVADVVDAVDGLLFVFMDFHREERVTKEVVAAPRAALVFVAKLTDLDHPVVVAFHFDPEVDSVAPKIAWILRRRGTAVNAITIAIVIVIGLCRTGNGHGSSKQTQRKEWNQGNLCPA